MYRMRYGLPKKLQALKYPNFRKNHRVIGLYAGLAVLALSPFIIFSLIKSSRSEAVWFNDNWQYRKQVNITNTSGGDLTDFQISFTLDTESAINDGKMQADCDDIRVTDINGALLNHWIEANSPGCDDSATQIWTKVPAILNGGSRIYVYYGNSSADNVEDPAEVFTFFDNFDGSGFDSDKWTEVNGSVTVSGGLLTIASTGDWWMASDTATYLITNDTFGSAYVTESLINTIGADGHNRFFGLRESSDNNSKMFAFLRDSDGSHITNVYRDSTAGTANWYGENSGAVNPGNNNVAKFVVNGDNITGYYNDSQTNSRTVSGWNLQKVALTDTHSGSNPSSFDWIFVRKFASPDPTASLSSEETGRSPIAYYKFDEGQGQIAYDFTGDNDLQLGSTSSSDSADPSWITEDLCVSGKCLRFDGTADYAGDSSNINLANKSFTVAVWARPTEVNNHQYLLSHGTGSSSNGLHFGYTDTNNFRFSFYDDDLDSSSTYDDRGKWHHWAGTYDASTNERKLYRDGVLIDSDTADADYQGTGQLQVGAYFSTHFYNGFIDEVKIYPYVRNDSEIKQDYISTTQHGSQAVLGAKDEVFMSEGLVSYLKMDETSANTCTGGTDDACDSSGNGNDGLWNGDATSTIGKFGHGTTYDGTGDSTRIAISPAITGPMAYSLWMYMDSDQQGLDTLIGQGFPSYADLRFGGGTNAIQFIYTNTPGAATPSVTIPKNQWNHLVATYDGERIYIYLNGVLGGSTAVSSSLSISGVAVGDRYFTSGFPFTGKVDEVRIYNRSLNESEVRELYNWAPPPVLHLRMDDNVSGDAQTLLDSSGNSLNGTTNDGANDTGMDCTEQGQYGRACRFDGVDDYFTVSDNPKIDLGTNFSISTWIKPADTGTGAIAFKGSGCTIWSSYSLTIGETEGGSPARESGKINFGFRTVNGGTNQYVAQQDSLTAGSWIHVLGTYDGSSLKLYLNGKLDNSASASGVPFNHAHALAVGADPGCGVRGEYSGLIDDLRIYDYERTPSQVVQDMNSGHPAVGSPIASAVAHYKFDEGYGDTSYNWGNGGSDLDADLQGSCPGDSTCPTWTNAGKSGKALSYDGGDYVDMGNDSSIQLTSGTLSAWIKTSNAGSSYRAIATKRNAYGLFLKDNILIVFDWNSGGADRSTGINLADNEWHYVAVTFQSGVSGGTQVWIDGKSVLSTTMTVVDQTYSFQTGSSNFAGQNFNGIIDEVKIYNYVLTNDEIKTDYNFGKSAVLGSISTESDGTTGSFANSREYCVPGDASTCDAPVGEWKLDEGSGNTANDTSGSGYNGSLTSSPSWVEGKYGKGIYFDGANRNISLGAGTISGAVDGASAITISSWVKVDSFPANSARGRIFSANVNGGSTGFTLLLFDDSGLVGAGGRSAAGDSYQETTTAYGVTGEWAHLTGILDYANDQIRIYINGVHAVTESKTFSSSTYTNGSPGGVETIGAYSGGGTSDNFNGIIDQVRVYDYARTPAQIAWEYNRGSPIMHYKFDECEGTVINDWAPDANAGFNGNNGTLNIGSSGANTTPGACSSGTSSEAWNNGTTGKYKSAMSFDGTDDYVNAGDPSSGLLDFGTGDFSISVWVKRGAVSNSIEALVNKRVANNTTNVGFNTYIDESNQLFVLFNSGGTMLSLTNLGLIDDTNWHHVTFAFDRDSNLTTYIDGKQVGQADISSKSGSISNSENLYIATRTDGSLGRFFNGLIDEVKIYNYVLTDEQVRVDYLGAAVRYE